jgi:hypothetical protein
MAKARDRRKAKAKTKPKTELAEPTVEAKMALAMAFEGAGGVPALIAWARTNERTRTAFYMLYGKTVPLTVGAQVNHKIEADSEQTQAKFLEGLNRIIETERRYRESGMRPAATFTDGSTGITTDANTGEVVAARNNMRLAAPTSPSQQPAPDPPSAPRPKPVTPLRVVSAFEQSILDRANGKVRNDGPPVVGLYAGAANGIDGADDGRSNPDKAMDYYGFGKQQ